MFYKRNKTDKLDVNLFKDPTSEYRGAPFLSLNTALKEESLKKQIEYLKEMGFGGFHLHPRSGMTTRYLSDEFMSFINTCAEKAEKEDMLAWLYDEDRWPSGAAGGFVTENPKFGQKKLVFTIEKLTEAVPAKEGINSGKPYLIEAFDIVLNNKGELLKYNKAEGKTEGTLWYVYGTTAEGRKWFCGNPYVDTLSRGAIDEFIKITHEKYKEKMGEKFGKSIPAFFTDEPQFAMKETLAFASDKSSVLLPFTIDFFDTFKAEYGFDLIPHLPELLWQLPDNEVSYARYCYHDHISERFAQTFSDKIGKWCDENGIMFTGHMMDESELYFQTRSVGDVMRSYRGFTIPGIDMLCNRVELSTAKQAQSAVHQYGREGMMSELYGVTNWTFDFKGHKFQGDWQAALGVTVRVPHLSWVSMKGCSKRDYPASIHYQSPWYKEYPYVENHFARLNTVLTRGTPDVDVAVIHPSESYWLYWGPSENTACVREELENNFDSVIRWLLFGTIDFDFLCESLLAKQTGEISDVLEVGKMKYKTVIVPDCRTLRGTTVEILEKFQKSGGKVIFMSDCPEYIDAKPSDGVEKLYKNAVKVQFSKQSLLSALSEGRKIEIKNENGVPTDNLIYNLRDDNGCKWLFIAHAKELKKIHPDDSIFCAQKILIKVKGEFTPSLYDTVSGEIKDVSFEIYDGYTYIEYILYSSDSILLCLNEPSIRYNRVENTERKPVRRIDFKDKVSYSLEEPNVLLLDEAEYSLDGGEIQPLDEVLNIDAKIREILSYPAANGHEEQPWALPDEIPSHFVTLDFTFESEIDVPCTLAVEEAKKIVFNGTEVPVEFDGYYVDFEIYKVKMPDIKKGVNTLSVTMPVTARISLENAFLLGDFDVKVCGIQKVVTRKSDKIAFGTITTQGMPFYGGNVIYKTEAETKDCSLKIRVPYYRGALVKVILDGKKEGIIAYDPYELEIKNVKAGRHTVEFVLYGNRNNTFGSLHTMDPTEWIGPDYWYPQDKYRCYEYNIKDAGIAVSPVIEVFE